MDVCAKACDNCIKTNTVSLERLIVNVVIVNHTIPSLIDVGQLHSSKPGIAYDVTKIICQSSHLDCHFTVYPTDNYYTFENGSWGGACGEIMNGTYDTSLPIFYRTQLKDDYFTLSTVTLQDIWYFITRKPEPTHYSLLSFAALLKPFQYQVWLTVLMAVVTISLLVIHHKPKVRSPSELLAIFVNVAAFLIRKSQKFGTIDPVGKSIITVWGMAVVFITAHYTSSLLSSMIHIQPKPPYTDFQTMLECLKVGNCRMIFVPDADFWFIDIANDTTSKMHPIIEATKQFPPVIAKSVAESFQQIVNTRDVYLVSAYRSLADTSMGIKRFDCDLWLLEYTNDCHFMFRKNDRLVDLFDKKISLMKSTGIIAKITSTYPHISKCRTQDYYSSRLKKTTASPMQLSWIVGTIIISILGIAVGFSCLVVEIVASKCRKSSNELH